MATQTELLPPNAPPPSRVEAVAATGDDWTYGLKSKWPIASDLAGGILPCRLEGEVADLVRIPQRALNTVTDSRLGCSR
jgi:hypothetical protein